MTKTVVITGAAGFIGSHLAQRFLNDKFRVYGIDNFATGLKSNIEQLQKNSSFIFINADICDIADWSRFIVEPVELILHFASPASPIHYRRLSLPTIWANTIGLKNCLSFAEI